MRMERRPAAERHQEVLPAGLDRVDPLADERARAGNTGRIELLKRLTGERGAKRCGGAMDRVAFGHGSTVRLERTLSRGARHALGRFAGVETALLIAVPEAEPVVEELRSAHDWAAARGVPAHVTLLYPFVPREELSPAVSERVASVLAGAGVVPFEARFDDVRRFPGTPEVVYLAPEPRVRFERLILAFVEAFPAYPRYGGGGFEPIPHLTVSDDGTDAVAIEAALRERLPIVATVRDVWLMADSPTGWERLETFPLD
jgi:2'-5' RNA ligase